MTVTKKAWRVTAVNCSGVTNFTQTAASPSIIWDRVNVPMSLSEDYIDVGTSAVLRWSAVYEYDGHPFQGVLNVRVNPSDVDGSDSPTLFMRSPSKPARQILSVESIIDDQFYLTKFNANAVECTWDRVKITESGASAKSVEVKEPVTVWYKAVYEYEGETFDGSKGTLFVNDVALSWSTENQRWETRLSSSDSKTLYLRITKVLDIKYGLTTINQAATYQSIQWNLTQQEISAYPKPSTIIGLGLILFMLTRKRTRDSG
jgi:hypothetical protein